MLVSESGPYLFNNEHVMPHFGNVVHCDGDKELMTQQSCAAEEVHLPRHDNTV